MRKLLRLAAVFAVLLVPAAAYCIPAHNFSLNFGTSYPGVGEIRDYYSDNGIADELRVYELGLSYDFAPIEFLSIGAGLDVYIAGFSVDYTDSSIAYTDNASYTVLDPYVRLRGYFPIPGTSGIDIFAGGGAGYAFLAGSRFSDDISDNVYALTGGALSLRAGGGVVYNQDIYSATIDIGYKSVLISPSPEVRNLYTVEQNALLVNTGGLYVNIGASISFGDQKAEREEGEVKKGLENEVKELDTTGADQAGDPDKVEAKEGAELEPLDEKNYDAPASEPARVKAGLAEVEFMEDTISSEAAPAATAVPAAAEKTEEKTPVPAATAEAAKETPKEIPAADLKEAVQIDEGVDTEGIIIISPGESEAAELEKYITNKSKQFKPLEEEEEQVSGDGVVFEYEPEDSGIIVVEAESKGTVDKAGYVLVEKGGFISNNFGVDGYIYSLDEHKELLVQGDLAYIKLTAGIGAPKNKQFAVFDDSEEVTDRATGESLGKLIKFLGVVKVLAPIEENIFKVKILKSYDPIMNNYKIKARNDLKKYHKELNLKVRKKNAEIRAFIVKVKDDVQNLKSRDLVYIDAGITKGLLPGQKLGIYRLTTEKETGKESEYHRIGTMIIINAMQTTATGFIVKSESLIRVGDIVKTEK